MSETRIEARKNGGIVDGRLFVPDGAPSGRGWPLVVMYMDAFGLRPTLSAMAERLVAHGYAVLQPNLYSRVGPFEPFDVATAFENPPERARLMGLVNGVEPEQAMSDTRALVAWVTSARRDIRADRFGSVGYCMGGRLAFISAERIPERVVAAACIHPGGLVTDRPDSPHRAVAEIRGALYIAAADEDRGFTPEQRATLAAALGEANVDFELEFYRGARHGFAVPDHSVYAEAAAEQQWQRVFALFERTLRKD